MTTRLLGLRDVAKLLRVKYYQIDYALKSGQVPDVKLRLGNRRLFQMDEVKRLADFFGVTLNEKEAHAQ